MYTGAGLAGARFAGLAGRQLRLLALALLASLVLHLLVLYALPMLKEAARMALPPLRARLAKPAPPAPPQAETPPPQPQPHAAAKTPRPAPVRAVPPAPVLAVEPARQAAESAPVVPAARPQPAPPPPAARPEPAPAAAAGPDPGSVARFRLELMDIARRTKRYPRIAQDNNWEGRVELRIAFGESGAMSSLAVRKGSGHAVLDEEAQAMIRRAQAQASLPPALRGRAFTLEIPVDFFLREEGN
jgi:protein TonB